MIELNFPNAVHDRCDLFGRDREIDLAIRALTGPSRLAVVLLGERLVGRTSVQWIVASEIERESGGRFVALSVPHAHTLHGFATEIFATLNAAIAPSGEKEKLLAGMTLQTGRTQAQYLADYQRLSSMAPDTTFVLSIDDFDALLHESPPAEKRAILAFTLHLIEHSRLPLAFLFTMCPPIPSGEDNSIIRLLARASRVELRLFDEAATASFAGALIEPKFQLDADAQGRLYALSGGHPYFVKLIFYHLVAVAGAPEGRAIVSAAQIERAVARALASFDAELVIAGVFNAHLSEEEQQALRWLAGSDRPVSLRAAHSHATALLWLVQRGYLRLGAGDTIAFQIGFLQRWLRANPAPSALESPLAGAQPRPDDWELAVDGSRPLAYLQGREIRLTPLEHRVLRSLARRAEQLVDKDTLALEAWDASDGVTDQSIDQVIRRVRQKLGDKASDPVYLYTHPGYGYILRHATYLPAPGE